MLTSLLLLATAGLAAPAASDPAIHIWYSSDGHYTYGDRAKVYARADDDGYQGARGREAFVAEDSAGQGLVLAAWSPTPFTFDRYVKNGRWDLDALAGHGAQSDDAEARLMDIVDAMRVPGGHFDYDVATYTVTPPPRYVRAAGPYPYEWGWWGYNPWWGFGPPVVSTRVFVPVGHVAVGRRFHR